MFYDSHKQNGIESISTEKKAVDFYCTGNAEELLIVSLRAKTTYRRVVVPECF